MSPTFEPNTSPSDGVFPSAKVVDTASEQQVVGAEQVSLAMSNVDQAMRQNLKGISQLEDTARKLEALAISVTQMLAKYKT